MIELLNHIEQKKWHDHDSSVDLRIQPTFCSYNFTKV